MSAQVGLAPPIDANEVWWPIVFLPLVLHNDQRPHL